MVDGATELQRLTITLSDRDDGGLRVHSADVPGLHLSGSDGAAVWAKLPLTVKALLAANGGLHVLQVYTPPYEAARTGPSPRTLPLHVRHATLIVEIERVAA